MVEEATFQMGKMYLLRSPDKTNSHLLGPASTLFQEDFVSIHSMISLDLCQDWAEFAKARKKVGGGSLLGSVAYGCHGGLVLGG